MVAITSSECHSCLVEPSEVDKIMSICCILSVNCYFNRVTAGYFYLKRGKTGPMPAELFDYKYVLIILVTIYFIRAPYTEKFVSL